MFQIVLVDVSVCKEKMFKVSPRTHLMYLLPQNQILVQFVDNLAFLFLNQNELDLIEQAKLN